MTNIEQEAAIARLKGDYPDALAEFQRELDDASQMRSALAAGPFPGMGTGDPDFYKAFAWRFWTLLAEEGAIGVVLPRSIFATKGSTLWRQEVFGGGTCEVYFCLNQKEWLFSDVNPGYSIGLVAIRKDSANAGVILVAGTFKSRDALLAEGELVRLDLGKLRKVDQYVCLPGIDSVAGLQLFQQLIVQPTFGQDRHDWAARPATELHATNDDEWFTSSGHPVHNHLT